MADKNIVDRTKAHRNADLARTVRETRDRLSQQPGNPAFDREMLRLHAGALTGRAAVLPVLAAAVAAAGLVAGMGPQVAIWAALTAAAYGGLGLFSAHIVRKDAGDIDVPSVRIMLLCVHAMTGLCWTWFALLSCETCQIDQFSTVKGVVLLVAIAATAILAYALRGALLATFGIAVAAYVWLAVNLWNPVDAAMAVLLAASLPFFSYIAGHLHRSAVMLLSFRTEKDGLIAELETAKSISDEARRRAEEANLAKSRFLASMSHELRTPLNAILGFSEVMAEQVLGPIENETYRDYARSIHDSGHHLLALINEILDISRIEAGRYKLQEEPIDLAHLVDECCNMIELKAHNKDLHIVREFEPDLPRLYADERAVRQITLNLLSNAIKFAPTGSEIRVRAGWTTGGGQYVSVRDNGPGIPAEEIPVVLSAFGQGSIAIKSAEQGTGLGLPIVQGLLDIHGGRFELRSKLRLGTEAIAIFPAARVMAPLDTPVERTKKASAA